MAATTTTTGSQAKIAVIYYSMYNHVEQLAEAELEGARSVPGVQVDAYQIQETLSEEILGKMYAGGSLKPKYPIIKPSDLTQYDGILFGFPTRYGRTPAQVSAFFDATGGLWASGALVGKFAGIFTSTASQHGGQETTALTTLPFLAHHGMIYVPSGFVDKELSDLGEIIGGSAWGAATIANGDGSRQPSTKELAIAKSQGKRFTETVATFVRGKHLQTTAAGAAATSSSSSSAAPVALGKELPANAATASQPTNKSLAATDGAQKQEGYSVPDNSAPVAAAAPEAPAKDTGYPPAAAAAATAPATSTSTAPGATPAANKPKKKSGGLFASCCGKADNIE